MTTKKTPTTFYGHPVMFEQDVDFNTLVPADYNPRVDLQPDDVEYQQLRASVERWGVVEPLVVNAHEGRERVIVGGHQRWKVCLDLGYDHGPVMWVNLDLHDEKALNLALNKVQGQWDEDVLAGLLEELRAVDFELNVAGFSEAEVRAILDDVGGYGVPPSTDDLKQKHGEALPDDFWPVISLKVPPERHEQYQRLIRLLPGEDEVARFGAMLDITGRELHADEA